MIEWITKKGEDGRKRHIHIGSGSGSRDGRYRHHFGLTVRPERSGGDLEYEGTVRNPKDGVQSARKHVYDKEFHGISPNDIKEEYFYYSPEGNAIDEDKFRRDGGSFDYIAEGPTGKFQVNAEVEWKSSHWALSGIGNWMDGKDAGKEPQNQHLYREGAEPRERKKFEDEYGKKKGGYVYGAVVGKVKRERESKARKAKR